MSMFSSRFIYCALVIFLSCWHFTVASEPATLPSPSSSLFLDPGPVVEHIHSIKGQSLKGAFRIVQGKSGFLWLATVKGLLRFDGYEIKAYRHDQNNVNSLPHNEVRNVEVDEQGILWLLTAAGLSRFDPHTEQFTHFGQRIEVSGYGINSQLSDIVFDDVYVWMGSSAGLHQLNRGDGQHQLLNSAFDAIIDVENKTVPTIYLDRQRRLWFHVVGQGLFVHDLTSGKTRHFLHDANDEYSLDSDRISTITQTRDGVIWIGTNRGVNQYLPDTNQFKRFAIKMKNGNNEGVPLVSRFFEDRAGRLWVGTLYNGVSVLKNAAGPLISVNEGAIDTHTLNALDIVDITQDNSGAIWFLSAAKGLFKLLPDALVFEHLVSHINVNLSMNTLFTDSDGALWLGTDHDLYVYRKDSSGFALAAENIGTVKMMVENHDKSLVLAVEERGLLRFDPQIGQTNPYAGRLPSEWLTAMVIDKRGVIWLGFTGSVDSTTAGLYSVDSNTGQYNHRLSGVSVESLALSLQKPGQKPGQKAGQKVAQQLLVGSRRAGLKIYDLSSDSWTAIEDNRLGPLWSLYQDTQLRVWLGTTKSGLVQLDLATKALTFFTYENSLPNDHVMSIVEDHQGDLWLGGHSGIARFNPQTGKGGLFDFTNGLRLNSVLRNGSAVMPSGDVVMTSVDEFVQFSPRRLSALTEVNSTTSGILLTKFRLANRLVPVNVTDSQALLSKTINETQAITLSYEQDLFSLTFASQQYSAGDSIRYASKMQGLSERWVETGGFNRVATFNGLSPGQYEFQVKASNPDGSWNPHVRSLKVTITPPWWATNWAYAFYALLVISSIGLFNFVRTKQLRQHAEKLEIQVAIRTTELKARTETITELLEDKEQLFANISHEFRTPLTLILGPLEAELKKNQ